MFERHFRIGLLALAIGSGVVGPAGADEMAHGMAEHATAGGPSVEAYRAASERMHRAMAIEFSGDADLDFARGMIPHHQGAIDMAQALLEHGADPELRSLAEGIIRAQQSEIAFLRAWLERRGPRPD